MEREPRDWISAWRFCAKSFIVKGPCQFIFMWFIRCHRVVHFNLMALNIQQRGPQSWRYQRTGEGKQNRELAPLSLFHRLAPDAPEPFVQAPATASGRGFLGCGCPGVRSPRRGPACPRERGRGSGSPGLPASPGPSAASLPPATARAAPGVQRYNASYKFDHKHLFPT